MSAQDLKSPLVVLLHGGDEACEAALRDHGSTFRPLDAAQEGENVYGLGAGAVRPNPSAVLDGDDLRGLLSLASLSTQVDFASYQRGTFNDFLSGEETPNCTVHVVALFSSESPLGRTDHAIQLCRALTYAELPVRVHAILDGRDMAARSAQAELERFERAVPEAKLVTLLGRDFCLGEALPWEKAVRVQQLFSENYEGAVRKDFNEALEAGYAEGQQDYDFAPVRLLPFRGVTGDLQCDFASTSPVWEWTGKDVAVLLPTEGAALLRLASVLTRAQVPAAVAEQLTVRGRAVVTFEQERIASMVAIPGFSHPPVIVTAATAPALPELAQRHGWSVSLHATQATRSAVGFRFQGDRSAVAVNEHVDSGSALAAAVDSVRSSGDALVVVGADGEGAEGTLKELAEAVTARGGTLVTLMEARGRIGTSVAGLEAQSVLAIHAALAGTICARGG
jgi:hypothetical protein